MINLNAIVQAAHDGEGINSLARQFDISPTDAQEAVQVLLPALSMGLQAQMQGPGFTQVLAHLATPQNRAAFEDADAAQSDDTIASGIDTINHLFGQENVVVQVAENANEHSSPSITTELLQSMLPIVAAMVMGGLFKSIASKGGLGGMFGQGEAAPAPQPESGGGGIGDILGRMTGHQAPAPAPQQGGGGIGDILGQLTGRGQQPQAHPQQGGGGLGDMLDRLGGGQQAQPQSQARPQGGGGLEDLLGGLLGGGHQRGGAAPQGGGGLSDILGQLAGGQRGQAGAPQQGGGGLGDLLGGLLGGGQPQRGQAASPQQQGGGLGDLLGGLLGGGQSPQAGAPGRAQGPGGIDPATIQAGLEQLSNMFGHGTNVSPKQQSGLDGILGQLFGGKR